MDENLGQDLELSHSVVNYLVSCYQGSFAALNMLSQLGYHDFNPDDVSRIQQQLTLAERLKVQMNQGIPVFSRTWKSPQTADAKETMNLLGKLKGELILIVNKLEKLITNPAIFENPEDTKFLIGSYCRFAYTNENYIKGFITFGESFTLPDIVKSYTAILPQAEKNIQAAHLFFDIFTAEEPPPQVFYKSLFEESLFLPGVFRTNIHDINRFGATYAGPFDFAHTDIPKEQAEEWGVISIDPNTAGYWHAYGFTARNMAEWFQIGVNAPRTAWFWNCLGFTAETAQGWVRFGFTPPFAREWVNENFSADQAIDHIQRGFTNPTTAWVEGRKMVEE